jgi:hypothetical protein
MRKVKTDICGRLESLKPTHKLRRVILGHAFNLSSNNISNLIVKNAGSLGMKSEDLNICQNMLHLSKSEGIYAGE